jgi:outer membrane receptor for monomeric catechols
MSTASSAACARAGLEFGASGNIGPRVQVFAGYTYTDAKITKTSSGKSPPISAAGSPTFRSTAARCSPIMLLTDHLQIGGQVYAQSKITGEGTTSLGHTPSIPGYVRLGCDGALCADRPAGIPPQCAEPHRQALL